MSDHCWRMGLLAKILHSKVVRFVFVGGTATLLQLVLLVLWVEWLNFHPVLASALSYGLSALYNYGMNYYVTFGSNKTHWETFPKFVLTAAVGVCVNTGVMALLIYLHCHYLIAQFGAILVTLVLNYLLHKFWIYRS